jgi:hypothetical protein
MPTKFTSKNPDRALQAWLILISRAMNRQTMTYEQLGRLMYPDSKKAAGVLNRILGHIAFYCKDNKLPMLTSIVVGKKRGAPGKAIPIDLVKIDMEREKVYGEDWFSIYPPTPHELSAAHARHK